MTGGGSSRERLAMGSHRPHAGKRLASFEDSSSVVCISWNKAWMRRLGWIFGLIFFTAMLPSNGRSMARYTIFSLLALYIYLYYVFMDGQTEYGI